jgi:internalin A
MLGGEHLGVDNESGTGLDALRNALAREAAGLDQMGERIHPRWTAAREDVQRHPAPQITRGEFGRICARHEMDDAESNTLANHLHDLGHIVHYGDDEGLKDVVVLQPDWLTKAISYVLEDTPTRQAGGVLDHARLREIWRERDGRAYPSEYHPYFLRLMEKFDVSYRLEDQPSSLIPQLVTNERPPLPWRSSDPPPEGVRKLALICTMNQEPPGLIAWLTVRNNRFAKGIHWRRGVLLAHEPYGSEALFEMLDASRLSLTVRAPSPDHFFAILRDSLEYLIERRWPGLTYDYVVPCPTVHDDGRRCEGEFEFRFLTRYRERGRDTMECRNCMEYQSIAELLTGFPPADVSLKRVLDEVNAQSQRVRADIGQLAGSLDNRLDQIKGIAATGANQMRAVLRAVGAEIQDCPRLFTLATAGRGRLHPGRLFSTRLRLTLWCEHPGAEHAWPEATYEVSEPRVWLQAAAPYALLVVRTLRVIVPVAGAVPGLVMQEDDVKAIQAHIDVTKAVVAALPDVETGYAESPGESGQLTTAEGRGLRALRALLVDQEGAMFGTFGGLRRALTPAGDWVWVCPRHYGDYDPGLPVLPAG